MEGLNWKVMAAFLKLGDVDLGTAGLPDMTYRQFWERKRKGVWNRDFSELKIFARFPSTSFYSLGLVKYKDMLI